MIMKKLLKKSLALILALVCAMNLGVVSFAAEEDSPVTSGSCGENLTWEFDGSTGTLTISGEGDMYDYVSVTDDSPWYDLSGDIKSIVLPDGLTGIGARAFWGCSIYGNVYIPAGVSYIGECAFRFCYALQNINVDSLNTVYASENGILFNKTKSEIICYPAGKMDTQYEIPQSVSVIGNYAFEDCFHLKEITIPDGVTSIGEKAFSNCEQLRSIAIPDSVTSIGTAAFESCNSLVTASVGNGVTSIPERMFSGCSELKEVTLCEGVTEIGKEAFGSCDQLRTVNIPLSVSRIGENAFNCYNLSEAYYPGTKEQWSLIDISGDTYRLDKAIVYECNSENANYGSGKCGDNLEWILYADGDFVITGTGDMYDYDYNNLSPWEYFDKKVKTVSLPEGLTGIGDRAFYHFLNVTDITIPGSVTRIGNSAFALCLFLTEINIPENVTSIGKGAFYYCIRLKSVTIPDGVKSIAPDVFSMCYSLEAITVDQENTAYFTDEKGVLYDTEQTVALAFPIKGITDYTIPASVEYLELTNLLYAKDLRNLFVEEGNASYSSDANGVLYNKDKTEILLYPIDNQTVKYTVPDTVTGSDYIFAGLKNLEEIVIPSGVDADSFFLFCENLKTVTIGADVDYIQSLGFAGCKSLEKIVVSEDNPNYSSDENGVLYNKDKTELMYVPAKSFEDTFEIPDTVVTVDSSAFIDCENFTLIIPETTLDLDFSYLSAKEFIVSEDHPTLKAIDGVLYFCETDENGNEITYLLKYPVCSDRKDFFVPENVVIAAPNAFYSPTSYVHYPTNLGVEPDESRMIYKVPEDLTLHFSSPTEEVLLEYLFFLKGPKSIYLCDVKTEDMTPEMLVDYINTYRDDQYKDIEEGLEEKLKDYDIHAAEFYRQLYKEEREIIPDFRLCDGEHSTLHSYTATVTTAPTCTTEGVMTYTCDCGDTYTEVIPATDHSWGEWVVVTQPTNYQEGLKQRACSSCGDRQEEIIPANGDFKFEFDKDSGTLTVSGAGIVDAGFENEQDLKGKVKYIEFTDGITGIGKNAFCGFTALKEVYLPETVTEIAAGAFSDCENLSIVTMLADNVSVENSAFTNANSRLFFVAKSGTQTLSSLEGAGFTTVPFSVTADEKMEGKKVLAFGGKTVLYDSLDYNYVSNLMFSVPDLYYVKFDKMTLHGVPTSQDFIVDIDVPEANVDVNEEYLTMTDVYMYVKVDGENVSFAEMLERIANGDYSGLVFTDYTEDSEEKTFIQQIAEFFDRIAEGFEDAFSFVTEAFNAIIGTITRFWKKIWK